MNAECKVQNLYCTDILSVGAIHELPVWKFHKTPRGMFFQKEDLKMYEIKPLTKENIKFIFETMSETNNISALHTQLFSLEDWEKCLQNLRTMLTKKIL